MTKIFAQAGEGRRCTPPPSLLLYLPSPTKLWCTLQLRGQIPFPYFFSTPYTYVLCGFISHQGPPISSLYGEARSQELGLGTHRLGTSRPQVLYRSFTVLYKTKLQRRLFVLSHTFCSQLRNIREPEAIFLNVYGAQESIPSNEFRQPGGPVR